MSMTYSSELDLHIEDVGRELLVKTFKRSMLEIQNLAKMKAAVDTGNLRNSIQLDILSDTKILITSFASYSYFVEFGTIYMKAQPFLRPAIDEVRFKRIKEIAKQVQSTL